MKKLFLFFLVISFVACSGGVEKYAGAINGVASNWESTTETFTGFVENLNSEKEKFNKIKSEMTVPEDASEDMMTKLKGMMSTFAEQGNVFSKLTEQTNGFAKEWQEKSKDLTALKEGLEAGKIEGDVQAKIDGLSDMISTAKEKVGGWEEMLAGASKQISSIYQQYQEMTAAQEG